MMLLIISVLVIGAAATFVAMPRVAAPSAPVRQIAALDHDAELKAQMRRDAELFAADPTAFFNDPHRYGGKRLEELQSIEPMAWMRGEGPVPAHIVKFLNDNRVPMVKYVTGTDGNVQKVKFSGFPMVPKGFGK